MAYGRAGRSATGSNLQERHLPRIAVVIPARMASTRLPGKPLADIAGAPMVVHVWRRAVEAGVGPVVVACAEAEIAAAVRAAGGVAVMTRPDHASGSDRVFEALGALSEAPDVVVNLQGDLPTLDPALIRQVADIPADVPAADLGTLVALARPGEAGNPDVTKAAVGFAAGERTARALYFSRAAVPAGAGPHYHHIGIYAWRREALARFVALAPTPLEMRERLEQLRALEHGMAVYAALVDTVPLGVDTPADLERARRILSENPDA